MEAIRRTELSDSLALASLMVDEACVSLEKVGLLNLFPFFDPMAKSSRRFENIQISPFLYFFFLFYIIVQLMNQLL